MNDKRIKHIAIRNTMFGILMLIIGFALGYWTAAREAAAIILERLQ
jgi:hypothetical protein